MGTYSSQEFLDTFGGLPERGECYPDDLDALIDEMRERESREPVLERCEVYECGARSADIDAAGRCPSCRVVPGKAKERRDA